MKGRSLVINVVLFSAELALATQQQIHGVQQIATTGGKPKVMDIQQQQSQQGKPNVGGQRPLSILPSSLQAVQAANIRAASSVSTQTVQGVQATVQAQVTILISARNYEVKISLHTTEKISTQFCSNVNYCI